MDVNQAVAFIRSDVYHLCNGPGLFIIFPEAGNRNGCFHLIFVPGMKNYFAVFIGKAQDGVIAYRKLFNNCSFISRTSFVSLCQ